MGRDLCGWVRWHGVEITVVAALVAAAVGVSPWWAVVAVVVVAHWVWLEVRVHRGLSRRRPPVDADGMADADDTADAS